MSELRTPHQYSNIHFSYYYKIFEWLWIYLRNSFRIHWCVSQYKIQRFFHHSSSSYSFLLRTHISCEKSEHNTKQSVSLVKRQGEKQRNTDDGRTHWNSRRSSLLRIYHLVIAHINFPFCDKRHCNRTSLTCMCGALQHCGWYSIRCLENAANGERKMG